MDTPVLSDPAVFPTEEVLHSHLGKAAPAYDSLFQFNHTNFPELVERWKFYNDGKSWLLNVSRKGKTVFWLSVKKGAFRTTFYLNPKAVQLVPGSKIPQKLKDEFKGTEGKKFRGLTVVIGTKKDAEIYKEALAIKIATM